MIQAGATRPQRRAVRLFGLLCGLVAATALPQSALAVTHAGSAGEIAVFTSSSPLPAADQLGQWRLQDGQLRLSRVEADHDHWFVPQNPTFRDGFVRMTVETPRAGRLALGVRMSLPNKDPTKSNGYAVVLTPQSVSMERWDGGRLRPLDKAVPLPTLISLTRVELEVWAVGPHLGVQVIDGVTLRPLASLSVSDSTYEQGRTGLWLLSRSLPAPAVLHWSVRAAGLPSTPPGPAEPRAPQGLSRYIKIAQQIEITSDLKDLLHQVEDDVYRIGVPELERLLRQSVPLQVLDVDAPLKWQDPTYVQWHRRDASLPVPGLPPSYRDPTMVEQTLRRLAAEHPQAARLVSLGTTAQGRQIWALRVWIPKGQNLDSQGKSTSQPPAILITGGHHADELLSVDFALDAAQGLLQGGDPRNPADADAALQACAQGLQTWVVPVVNPDGLAAAFEKSGYAGRKNARDSDGDGWTADDGIDINRNYPFFWHADGEVGSRSRPHDPWYRGPAPGSERETQALMALADRVHFAASLSYHTLGTVILAPYTANGTRNPQPNDAWQLASVIAHALPRQANGRHFVVKKQIYPVAGVDQDWLRASHGTAALLLEGALQNPWEPTLHAKIIADTRPSWRQLLLQVLHGPRVSGQVLDARGRPATAEVVVLQQAPQMGERWLSRCQDGHFDRILAHDHAVTLQVRVPGQATVELEVPAHSQAPVMIQLPYALPQPTVCAVPALCSQAALKAQRENTCLSMDIP